MSKVDELIEKYEERKNQYARTIELFKGFGANEYWIGFWNGSTELATEVSKDLKAIKAEQAEITERQKPIVPKFVAEWYEENKNDLEFRIWQYIYEFNEHNHYDEFRQWMNGSANKPIKTLFQMEDGYEVEQEQLYYVILAEKKDGWKYTFWDKCESVDFTNILSDVAKFTEAEIKAKDERYWAFAVPVKEEAE